MILLSLENEGRILNKNNMDVSKVIQQHKRLSTLVSEKKIKQSLDILADMIQNSSSGDMHDEYNDIEMTYRNMLTYTIEGIKDPERNKVYLKLIQSILHLSDRPDKTYCHIIQDGIHTG